MKYSETFKQMEARIKTECANDALDEPTFTQRYTEHVSLACRWLDCNNRKITEMAVSRTMRRMDADTLRHELRTRGVEI